MSLALSLALSVALAPTLPQEAWTTPYEPVKGLIMVKAKVNDRIVNVVVDSGAGTSCLDADLMTELKLEKGASETANGVSGSVETAWVKGAVLSGLAVPTELAAISLPLSGLDRAIGRRVDLILGYDFLRKYSLEIDPKAKSITFRSGAIPASAEKPTEVPFVIKGGRPYINCSITKANGENVTAELSLDTGSVHFVVIDHAMATRHGFESIAGKVAPRVGGIGGFSPSTYADIKEVKLGGWVVKDAEVWITKPANKGAIRDEGTLGMGALSKGRTILDYPNKKLLIWPY